MLGSDPRWRRSKLGPTAMLLCAARRGVQVQAEVGEHGKEGCTGDEEAIITGPHGASAVEIGGVVGVAVSVGHTQGVGVSVGVHVGVNVMVAVAVGV